jgi:hypothetical protein
VRRGASRIPLLAINRDLDPLWNRIRREWAKPSTRCIRSLRIASRRVASTLANLVSGSSNTKPRRPPQCLPAPMPEGAQTSSFGYRNGARLAHAYQHSGNAHFVVRARVRKIALPDLRAVWQYPNSRPPVLKARKGYLVALGMRTASSCSQAGGISCSRGPAAAPVDPLAALVDFRPGPGGRRRQRKTCKPQWLPK